MPSDQRVIVQKKPSTQTLTYHLAPRQNARAKGVLLALHRTLRTLMRMRAIIHGPIFNPSDPPPPTGAQPWQRESHHIITTRSII